MNKEIVKVDLENRSYDIVIGNDILEDFAFHLKKFSSYSKIFIITDSNVAKLHLQNFSDQLNKSSINHQNIILEAGEKTKDFSHLQNLCDQILEAGIDRKTLLVAFGGGVIGDLCGFVASILLRGIDFIQVPTTLLAMVDSSVGGKTAINSKHGKNLIGSFYQPKLVFCDLKFLQTLPEREFLSGYGEVVKYGLIRDKKFFEYLENNLHKIKERDVQVIKKIVVKSCAIKAEIVSEDEKEENDFRALLNFGHSFAHVFETETNYSEELMHGEAVALGMVMAAQMSRNFGMIDEKTFLRIKSHLENAGFKTSPKQIRKRWDRKNLVTHIFKDKKNSAQGLTFILLDEIGQAMVKKAILVEEFEKILDSFL